MNNCLTKSILLYVIIMIMIYIIKPPIFYYDNKCTKLKKWNIYKETGNARDLCNFHTTAIILGILCYVTCHFF